MNLTSTLVTAAAVGIFSGLTGCSHDAPPAESPAATSEGTSEAPAASEGSSESPAASSEGMSGDDMANASPGKHACKGQNDCKGQGGCKTDKHACKGQNDCKGQGGCKTT